MEEKLCECGCGQIVRKSNRFIHGHSQKGKNNSFYGKKHSKKTKVKMFKNRRKPVHKTNCQCCICKNRHGELKGKNSPMYGRVSWSKGLTKVTDPRLLETSKKLMGKNNPMYDKHHTPETIRKIKEKTKERISKIDLKGKNHPWFGRHHTEESKEKCRLSNLGKKRSKETRKKISNSRKGKTLEDMGHNTETCNCAPCRSIRGEYIGENNPFYGKTHTAETKEKLRENLRNETSPSGFEIKVFNKIDKIFPNIWKHNVKWKKRFSYKDKDKITKFKYPDIYHKSKDVVIEVNGIYWHTVAIKQTKEENEEFLSNVYKKYNIQCIVIWEDDFEHACDKEKFIKERLGVYCD